MAFGIDDIGMMIGSQVLGAALQGDSAKDAANIQGQAASGATAEQRRQFDVSRADLAPYRQVGSASVRRIGELLGLTGPGGGAIGSDWRSAMKEAYAGAFPTGGNPEVLTALYGIIDNAKSPEDTGAVGESPIAFAARTGIPAPAGLGDILEMAKASAASGGAKPEGFGSLNKQFTEQDFNADPVIKLAGDYGERGIDRNLGALGLKKSGLMLKSLFNYGGTKAGESRGRFYEDQDRIFNRLAGVSGTGQAATTTGAQLGANTAGNIGNIMTGLGNARGASAIAQGNAWGNAFSNIGQWWNSNRTLDKILKPGGGIGGGTNPYGFYTNSEATDY